MIKIEDYGICLGRAAKCRVLEADTTKTSETPWVVLHIIIKRSRYIYN
jgi:hypothetical protein